MTREGQKKHSFDEWNELLRVRAKEFAEKHPDSTVIVYSSWATFSKVLDDPKEFGMEDGDQQKMNGTIWFDHIHPTSKMHGVIATDVEALLKTVPPS